MSSDAWRALLAAPLVRWPEYLMEGALLGLFMVSACVATTLVESSRSSMRRHVRRALARRAAIGVAMGLTAVLLIESPWGQRSGAHMNPAVTIGLWTLGKVGGVDAVWYIASQFFGGALGVLLSRVLLGGALASSEVRWVVTEPGPRGAGTAFLAEFVMSFTLLGGILVVSGQPSLANWTSTTAGLLLAVFITFLAPLSGMSVNPARTLASAVWARSYRGLWLYGAGPVMGMLAAASLYAAASGPSLSNRSMTLDSDREMSRSTPAPAVCMPACGLRRDTLSNSRHLTP